MPDFEAPAPPYVGPAKFQGAADNKLIDRIVMHGTVSPCVEGGARTIARYFTTTVTRPSSAHYVVDPGETVQVVYDSVVAYHAPPNQHSLGVEFCDLVAGPIERWDDEPHERMFARGVRLVAGLCLAYDVPAVWLTAEDLRLGRRGITDHDEVSKAFGQTSHWDLGAWPKRKFIRAVRAEIARRGEPAVPPPPPLVDEQWVDEIHNLYRKLPLSKMTADLELGRDAAIRGFSEVTTVGHKALARHCFQNRLEFVAAPADVALAWTQEFRPIGKPTVIQAHGAGPGVANPARYILGQGLVHVPSDRTVYRIQVHAAQGAAKPEAGPPSPVVDEWRNRVTALYWRHVRSLTLRELAASTSWDAIVCAGDFNVRLENRSEPYYAGPVLRDLYEFDDQGGIDRIIATHSSMVQQTRRWAVSKGVASDHALHFAEFTWR